ncbi:MAG: 3'-5' exonuclease [Victivallales bacterium]|nr:3'-5' exonuclease [Victivallales bacterium]
MAKLRNLNLARPIIFFDLEATGTNPQFDRIVEICVAKIQPGGETEIKSRRINPERPIPKESTEIHGITDEDVADEPTFSQVSASLFMYFENSDLAGYNINRFDIPLLASEFKRAGLNFHVEDRKVIDAQTIFHKMEPRTLSAAYKFFTGNELEDAHAAESDVLATISVLDGELEKYSTLPREVKELHDFCNPTDPNWIDKTGKFKWDDDGEAIVAFGKNKGIKLKNIAAKNPGFLSWINRMDFPDDAKKIAKEALTGKFPTKTK